MIRKWWVVTDLVDHGRIIADTDEKAEEIFSYGIRHQKYPMDAILVEQLPDEQDEEVEDINILSIEEIIVT